MRSMNETLANLAGKEIGRRTMIDYYPQFFSFYHLPGRESTTVLFEGYTHPFDFRAEMRKTRVNVDAMLEQGGQIEQAERYMEARREYFWENGYHLRKINQAYFAFTVPTMTRPEAAPRVMTRSGPLCRVCAHRAPV